MTSTVLTVDNTIAELTCERTTYSVSYVVLCLTSADNSHMHQGPQRWASHLSTSQIVGEASISGGNRLCVEPSGTDRRIWLLLACPPSGLRMCPRKKVGGGPQAPIIQSVHTITAAYHSESSRMRQPPPCDTLTTHSTATM